MKYEIHKGKDSIRHNICSRKARVPSSIQTRRISLTKNHKGLKGRSSYTFGLDRSSLDVPTARRKHTTTHHVGSASHSRQRFRHDLFEHCHQERALRGPDRAHHPDQLSRLHPQVDRLQGKRFMLTNETIKHIHAQNVATSKAGRGGGLNRSCCKAAPCFGKG